MEIIKYRCDICGSIYDTKEECQNCQSSHHTNLYIKSISFSNLSIMSGYRENDFPFKIVVSDVDQNETREYFLKK